jgi:cytochrome c553
MRAHATVMVVTALVLGGCPARDGASDARSPGSASITVAPAPAAKPPFKARMKDHALLGIAMRDAVARGELLRAQSVARELAQLPVEADLEPPRRQKLDAMVRAAQQMSRAGDVRDAARSVAAIAETCGACHTTYGGPRLVEPGAPVGGDDEDAARAMARHQWAAARMWEGLAAPSDDLWSHGARTLADAPLEPWSLTPHQTPVPKVVSLAASVHDLGQRAITSTGAARVDVYAEVLSTCATCHAWLGGGPAAPTTK